MKSVITGDIIESTKLAISDREKLMESVQVILSDLTSIYNLKSEIYRGDSFQILLDEPLYSFRVALILKMHIRSYPISEISLSNNQRKAKINDARIAIGVGQVENSNKYLGATNGEAFILSGHLLDSLKKTKQSLGIKTSDGFGSELETEVFLIDTIIYQTTALQCEVIKWKLLKQNEIEISHKLKIKQSAVNQRSNSGSWHAINTMVQRFETIYKYG